MRCRIGNVNLKNPIIAASGTFGYGKEMMDFFDINELGAFVTKTITLMPKEGNIPPRIYDLGFGILNSIGLENPGLEVFKKKYSDFFTRLKTKVFVSIYGEKLNEWIELIKGLEEERIAGFELNFSCPNLEGEVISAYKNRVFKICSTLRKLTKKLLLAKLSYTLQLKEITLSIQLAGIDAVVLINTLPAMAIEENKDEPCLGNIYGGLSGPCIKPIALRCVREISSLLKIAVIACGGVMDYRDVLDYLRVGAKAVEVGSANLIYPDACERIISKLEKVTKINGNNKYKFY
ncbi:MAG: dihydroorotate dehydrogenase [Candidatus Omnitrophica bacterium]|nr:dihydroorotate dehydrogenase [Candidatus Omnitrophota bacterium]MCM8825903.1 dihydroorotate dehydrogenase [Candidatus Omnitrophota bacterium]